MDVLKHITHWRRGAEEDLLAAEALLEKKLLRQSLFFAHLALEKMLKAHIVRHTSDHPPYLHNLIRLADATGLDIPEVKREILREFNVYAVGGRYPDFGKILFTPEVAKVDLAKAAEILKWLTQQL